MTELREALIAIFIRRGHKGKEIVEMVREIEALLNGQRCEWTLIQKGYHWYKTECQHEQRDVDRDYKFCPKCGKRIEVKDVG